jgi:hypothetical protein
MKKTILIGLFCLCFSFIINAQYDFGYRTFDAGLEYKWVNNSPSINIQAAYNSKLHHSFLLFAGYKTAYKEVSESHNHEKGNGLGGALGYRYYITVLPKGFFLGTRAELWSFNMYHTASEATTKDKLLIFQPNAEAGYTILINDIFYITSFLSAGKQMTLSSGSTYQYGNDFVPSFGINAGWRF